MVVYLLKVNFASLLIIENNIKIVPVGGISAFTSLLSVSGLSGNTLFAGFLSNKSGKRKNQLKDLYKNQKSYLTMLPDVLMWRKEENKLFYASKLASYDIE